MWGGGGGEGLNMQLFSPLICEHEIGLQINWVRDGDLMGQQSGLFRALGFGRAPKPGLGVVGGGGGGKSSKFREGEGCYSLSFLLDPSLYQIDR